MWTLCIEDDQAERDVITLEREEYTIGRAKESDLHLTERNVSRKHAKITREREHWILYDLGSENGTSLNGEAVRGSIQLDHGDRLYIGDYLLSLVDERRKKKPKPAQDNEDTFRDTADSLLVKSDRLAVLDGPGSGNQHPLSQRRLLIGRGEECDIVLGDTSISRVHASIEPIGDGRYLMTDEDSSNGIRVNGRVAPSMLLDNGDIVELGDVFLQFIPLGENFRPSAAAGASSRQLHVDSPSNRRVLGAVVGAVAMACGFFYLMKTSSTTALDLDPKLLKDAQAHFELGDVETAGEYLRRIPTASEVTTKESYRRIARTWADARLGEFQKAVGKSMQRGILSSIVDAHFVDSARREKAKDLLDALDRSQRPGPEESTSVESLAPFDGGARQDPSPASKPKRAGQRPQSSTLAPPKKSNTLPTEPSRQTEQRAPLGNNRAPAQARAPTLASSGPPRPQPLKRNPWRTPPGSRLQDAPATDVATRPQVSGATRAPAPLRSAAPYPQPPSPTAKPNLPSQVMAPPPPAAPGSPQPVPVTPSNSATAGPPRNP